MIERTQRTSERNSLIDLLKFICACSIVYIHTIVPFVGGVAGEIGRIISGFVNPVGFFMICTAYFSFVKNYDAEKDRINMTGIGNVCGRLYVLYFVWLMPYLYWELKLNFQAESVTETIVNIVTKVILTGGTSIFWYIHAVIYALILIAVLYNSLGHKATVLIVCIVHILSLSGDSYFNLVKDTPAGVFAEIWLGVFDTMHVLRGPANILAGFEIARNGKKIVEKIKKRNLVSIWLGFVILQILESMIVKTNSLGLSYANYFFKPFVSGSFFVTVLNCDIRPDLRICNLLGKVSVVIYFTHGFVIRAALAVFGAVNAWLLWAVCIIAGMIGTVIIIKVLKYPGLWWLKQILNF